MEEEEPAGQDGVEQCPGEIIKKNPWGSWSQGERERPQRRKRWGCNAAEAMAGSAGPHELGSAALE